MNRRSVTAVIPARYASTRLRAKPLVDLCGKPMIQHVYERAAQATMIDRVVVATDHPEIVVAVERFGGTAVMTPPELRTGSDRVAYVAAAQNDAGIIVNIQGDEPLILPAMIDQAIAPMIEDASIRAATLIRLVRDPREIVNPNIVKVAVDDNGFALYFSRSPIPHVRDVAGERWHEHVQFFKHIGLYVYDRETIAAFARMPESPLERAEKLEQLRLLSAGIRMKTTLTEFDSIPVDTAEDAERVRTLLRLQGQGD
jgi:3-deoxy-manno-octulosonate cytidylyltransferase (CMP-KDO synthetase)